MAVYRIFPQQDAFIFSEASSSNAGLDEILEIGGYTDISGEGETSRILIQFSSTEIADVVSNKIGSNNYSASLGLYLADAYQIPVNTTIFAYPVYSDVATGWDNGSGKYGDIPTNSTGVSWAAQKYGGSTPWPTSGLPAGVTYYTVGSKPGGGAWYTGSGIVSLEFTQSNPINSTYDIYMNVTDAVKLWNNSSISNNGFILKLSSSLEFNTTSSIRLKYFGADTNTIYPPYLEFKWDDSSYNVGSLSTLNNSIATVKISNNRGEYADVGKQRFRVTAQPKYPVRTFSTSSIYLTNYALPTASYWGLRDENTEEMIIDFDTQFTKISCDSNGGYFDVYMDGLQPERYYRILIKTTLDGSNTVIDSDSNIIKVVRNG
jgi:hypothetical protein